jgi:hypothetical protein
MSLILDGTNGLSDIDGSAATPALRGTDTNTGIFFPAADTIAFAEGGAEVMRINSSGFVGIGTTNPAYALDVRSASPPMIRMSRSGTAGQIVSLLFEDGNATLGAGSTTRIASDAGAMSFSTGGTSGSDSGGTERARIDSSGNLLIGATSYSGGVPNDSAIVIRQDGYMVTRVSGNGNYAAEFQNVSGTGVGNITVNSGSTQYVTSSDYRLKEDIAPMTGALATVAALKPVSYKWKATGEATQGFIAHELQAVVPECVVGAKDAVETYTDEDGNEATRPVYQGIDTSFLSATLTAALQELHTIVKAQAVEIADLKARLP